MCWKDSSVLEKRLLGSCLCGGCPAERPGAEDTDFHSLPAGGILTHLSLCALYGKYFKQWNVPVPCRGIGARGRVMFICIFSRRVVRTAGQSPPELETPVVRI